MPLARQPSRVVGPLPIVHCSPANSFNPTNNPNHPTNIQLTARRCRPRERRAQSQRNQRVSNSQDPLSLLPPLKSGASSSAYQARNSLSPSVHQSCRLTQPFLPFYTANPKTASPQAPPSTVNERTQQRYAEAQPYEVLRAKVGLAGLSSAEQTAWISSRFARSAPARNKLGTKAQRDVWRRANEASLPVRAPKAKGTGEGVRHYDWGKDRNGRDVGEYSIEKFEERTRRRITLTTLEVSSRAFKEKRERAQRGIVDPLTGEPTVLCENEIAEERGRRGEMAQLRAELYGEKSGSYAQDPEWDDIEPIPLEEPEGALAAIAYPDDYAEGEHSSLFYN